MPKKYKFSFAPMRKLMGDAGAELVSRDAVFKLMDTLEKNATQLTKKAVGFAEHAKRKKVTVKDLDLAINM